MAVLVLHAWPLFAPPHWTWTYMRRGVAGVSFFFVLSGFILTYNYWDKFKFGISRLDFKTYLMARFARIYPMHVAALLFMTAMIFWHGRSGQTLYSWILQLLLVQAFVPRLWTEWNGVAWSISAEAFFYLLFPLFVSFVLARAGRRKDLLIIAAICYGVEATLFTGAIAWLKFRFGRVDFDALTDMAFVAPYFRIWEFFIGCCLGRIYLLGAPAIFMRPGRRNSLLAASLAASAGVIVLPVFVPIAHAFAWHVLFTPIFGLMILCLAAGPTFFTPILANRAALLLGEASYSLYLIHLAIFEIVETVHGPFYHHRWPMALVIAACVGLSIVCFIGIETPARRWLRRLGSARTPPARECENQPFNDPRTLETPRTGAAE